MWLSEYPEYGRLRVSLHGTRDAAANWEDAYAKVLTEHGFARGTASPCSFCCKERGIRVVVHGDDFLSGGPRSQLGKSLGQALRGETHCDGRVKKSEEVDCHAEQTNFMEKFWDSVRAGHETLPKNCGCIESETSKNSGFTSSKGKRDRCAMR